ncbi:MAG: hypothetical protein PHU53_02095 [Thermoplasmata archaeon]|nr:hypothetical protein [Thermoplasmata archaeon]
MADAAGSRGDILKQIRTAEKAGSEREEKARAKVLELSARTQTECSKILEQAERDGRASMRQAIESARKECDAKKEKAVRDAEKSAAARETAAEAGIPALSQFIYMKFKKEYDVKD